MGLGRPGRGGVAPAKCVCGAGSVRPHGAAGCRRRASPAWCWAAHAAGRARRSLGYSVVRTASPTSEDEEERPARRTRRAAAATQRSGASGTHSTSGNSSGEQSTLPAPLKSKLQAGSRGGARSPGSPEGGSHRRRGSNEVPADGNVPSAAAQMLAQWQPTANADASPMLSTVLFGSLADRDASAASGAAAPLLQGLPPIRLPAPASQAPGSPSVLLQLQRLDAAETLLQQQRACLLGGAGGGWDSGDLGGMPTAAGALAPPVHHPMAAAQLEEAEDELDLLLQMNPEELADALLGEAGAGGWCAGVASRAVLCGAPAGRPSRNWPACPARLRNRNQAACAKRCCCAPLLLWAGYHPSAADGMLAPQQPLAAREAPVAAPVPAMLGGSPLLPHAFAPGQSNSSASSAHEGSPFRVPLPAQQAGLHLPELPAAAAAAWPAELAQDSQLVTVCIKVRRSGGGVGGAAVLVAAYARLAMRPLACLACLLNNGHAVLHPAAPCSSSTLLPSTCRLTCGRSCRWRWP